MKRLLSCVVVIVSFLTSIAQINPNTPWTWMKGSNQIASPGNYGIMGVASPSNEPFSRMGGNTFIDTEGNLWLFGGFSYLPAPMWYYFNDLWKYNPATRTWTWMKGSNLTNMAGSYGVKGVPSSTNNPGAREDAMSWTDRSGNFWIFGGDGYDIAGNYGTLADLWKYDVTTNNWTWVGGSEFVNFTGFYGTMGIPGPANHPPGRSSSVAWSDSEGNFWLFGGYTYNNSYYYLHDLWRYNVSSNEWTWMKGSNVPGAFTPVYGMMGISSPSNLPPGRSKSTGWVGDDGNFYLFGGRDFSNPYNLYNDLWKYSPITNEWTWVNGLNVPNGPAIQGIQGVPGSSNQPGARNGATPFKDSFGNLWLFGGYGFNLPGQPGATYLNDLWKYNPAINQWTWVKGGDYNAPGVYGMQGVASPSNKPGGRYSPVSWSDPGGVFWMFGGLANDATGLTSEINDLWKLQNASVLPVNLLEFSGRLMNEQSLLQWKISEFSTPSGFIVERSRDGRRYDSIGFVRAEMQKQFYNFSDVLNDVNQPDIYYRLKLIDQDNSQSYSKVIVLRRINLSLTVYPNPATGNLNFTVSKTDRGPVAYKIIDQLGKTMINGSLMNPGTEDKITVNISGLSPGIYRLVVVSGDHIRQSAFIKK